MTLPDLIQTALVIHEKTQDPLLMDSIRVLTSRNQPEALIRFAESNILACRDAFIVLYGSDGLPDDPDTD